MLNKSNKPKKTLKKFEYMGYSIQSYKLGKNSYEFFIGNLSGYGHLKVANIRAKDFISSKKKLKNWMKKGGHLKGGVSRKAYL